MDRIEKMRSFIIKFLYYGIVLGIIYCLLKYAMPLLMPFVVAFGIAFVLKPLINFITRKTPLSRKAAAIILLILLYLVVGTLIVLIGVRLTTSIGNWVANLPTLYRTSIEPALANVSDAIEGFLVGLDPAVKNFVDTIGDSISDAVSTVVSAISSGAINVVTGAASAVPWGVVGAVLTIIASFFFVADYQRITSFIVRQLPERGKRLAFVIKDYVVGTLGRFLRAYLILMSLTFAEVSVGLLILQVPNPFLIALVTAIVDILPVLGTGTIMIPWALYCLITGDLFRGIGLAVLYIVITFIRQVLEPRVVGGQIGLYPLVTLIAMFVGTRLFGFWGLFGFPITIVVLLHLNRAGEINLFKMEPKAEEAADSKPSGK